MGSALFLNIDVQLRRELTGGVGHAGKLDIGSAAPRGVTCARSKEAPGEDTSEQKHTSDEPENTTLICERFLHDNASFVSELLSGTMQGLGQSLAAWS